MPRGGEEDMQHIDETLPRKHFAARTMNHYLVMGSFLTADHICTDINRRDTTFHYIRKCASCISKIQNYAQSLTADVQSLSTSYA